MARRLTTTLSLVAAAVMSAAASGAGNVISRVAVDETSITITVPIQIVGANDATIDAWQHGIDNTWNRGRDGRPFEICGRRVRFEPVFLPMMATVPQPRPAHLVFVHDVAPGQLFVSSVWHALGSSPADSARTGFWGSNISPETAAHEFGHLLGLLDEYRENDANGNGLRDVGEVPVPDLNRFPDAARSLMAVEAGVVLDRHIRDIVRMHGLGDTLTCTMGR